MTDWVLSTKPAFLNEILTLPPKEEVQIIRKLEYLTRDPTPDAKTKKRLKGFGGSLHRLRAGDFRILYTLDPPHISVLALRRRSDRTYEEDFEAEFLGGPGAVAKPTPPYTPSSHGGYVDGPAWEPDAGCPLPTPITADLLGDLRIPEEFHAALLAAKTEDALLDCEEVPDRWRERVLDAVIGRPIEQIAAQPDLVVAEAEDLLRYKKGELIGFLLRLNPNQEKFVRWAVNAKGPTLLKGGPGTGKSTVALYRVREFLDALRDSGVESPRILFTTYTRALTRFSEQLLVQLLGEDAARVDVSTADAVAMAIVGRQDPESTVEMANGPEVRAMLDRAVESAVFTGNALLQAAQRRTIETLDRGYLQEEILGVIEGRQLVSLDDYLGAPRPGRRVPLGKTQREAVWRVREAFRAEQEAAGKHTWESLRAQAADLVAAGESDRTYDAVIVDEVQDLEPSAIRMLVGLCREPNRLFLTADANQSIYGGGFRWADVHEWLRFAGRTGILRANHRSTREIGEAAHDYLRDGAIDETDARAYVNTGPLPVVRAVESIVDEAKLLARFFRTASRELRLSTGACAVLCPFRKAAERIAAALTEQGLEATAMTGGDLDLERKGVKLLTLKSAKGLEFPIVAVAGFLDGAYPHYRPSLDEAAREEIRGRERRTLYVAMTRAMRALLVVVPALTDNPLLSGFGPDAWNLG